MQNNCSDFQELHLERLRLLFGILFEFYHADKQNKCLKIKFRFKQKSVKFVTKTSSGGNNNSSLCGSLLYIILFFINIDS